MASIRYATPETYVHCRLGLLTQATLIDAGASVHDTWRIHRV
jgi:hypothetical protein